MKCWKLSIRNWDKVCTNRNLAITSYCGQIGHVKGYLEIVKNDFQLSEIGNPPQGSVEVVQRKM